MTRFELLERGHWKNNESTANWLLSFSIKFAKISFTNCRCCFCRFSMSSDE